MKINETDVLVNLAPLFLGFRSLNKSCRTLVGSVPQSVLVILPLLFAANGCGVDSTNLDSSGSDNFANFAKFTNHNSSPANLEETNGINANMALAGFSFLWPAKQDYGLRNDVNGEGFFRASRGGGTRLHAGVDMLFPVGQRVYSPCNGQIKKNNEPEGYGVYVVVTCKLPSKLTKGKAVFVDFLYGHLSATANTQSGTIKAGQHIGNVGKTGNASGPSVLPHLHLEAVVKQGFNYGPGEYFMDMSETPNFNDSDNESNLSSSDLSSLVQSTCLLPNKIKSTVGKVYNDRFDPFLLLLCVAQKPLIEKSSLQKSQFRWSRIYSSPSFDINQGLKIGF